MRRNRAERGSAGYHPLWDGFVRKAHAAGTSASSGAVSRNLRWIRVLYTYPDWITDELLEVMAEEDKIVKYLDIPLQHCDQKGAAGNESAVETGSRLRP